MSWKDRIETFYYLVATIAALGTVIAALCALQVYRNNSRLERARWASSLYDKFYHENTLKQIRNKLDCLADSDEVNELIIKEDPNFTDYLNFFEFIALLENSNQLQNTEVEQLFSYYLSCLSRHERVRSYILDPANGYEGLAKLIGRGNV